MFASATMCRHYRETFARQPFLQIIHPSGDVSDLTTALNPKYDAVYKAIKPFTFKKCLNYQVCVCVCQRGGGQAGTTAG